jgi:hypothetical protein
MFLYIYWIYWSICIKLVCLSMSIRHWMLVYRSRKGGIQLCKQVFSLSHCLYMCSFGKMVACFRYASINVLSVYLPPAKVDFSSENQEWTQKETDEVQWSPFWTFHYLTPVYGWFNCLINRWSIRQSFFFLKCSMLLVKYQRNDVRLSKITVAWNSLNQDAKLQNLNRCCKRRRRNLRWGFLCMLIF